MPARPFSMNSPAPSHAARKAPSAQGPQRALLVLTVLVLLAHGLALRGAALQFGAIPDTPDAAPLETRLLTPAPPLPAVQPAPPEPVKRQKPQNPPKPPKNESNRPPAQERRAQVAPEIIAKSDPEPDAARAPAPSPAASAADPTPPQPAPAPPVSDVAQAAATAAAQAATSPPPPALSAMSIPGSIQLDYKMTGNSKGLDYSASAQLDWRNTGSSYETTMTVSAFLLGSRSMSSRGEIGPHGLAPLRFSDKRRKREQAAHFEREPQQIIFSNNAPAAPWFAGAQDRLSVFLQLAGMLAGNPGAYPVGTSIALQVAGAGGADTMVFKVEADETLRLPAGELLTVRLASQVRNDYDRKLEIWYAPAMQFLPVRVKYTQANSDYIDQQLSDIRRP